MKVIESLSAFIAHDDDGEGVAAFLVPKTGVWMPLFAADEARVKSLRPVAEMVARASGKRLTLVQFTTRTELETIEPPPKSRIWMP